MRLAGLPDKPNQSNLTEHHRTKEDLSWEIEDESPAFRLLKRKRKAWKTGFLFRVLFNGLKGTPLKWTSSIERGQFLNTEAWALMNMAKGMAWNVNTTAFCIFAMLNQIVSSFWNEQGLLNKPSFYHLLCFCLLIAQKLSNSLLTL